MPCWMGPVPNDVEVRRLTELLYEACNYIPKGTNISQDLFDWWSAHKNSDVREQQSLSTIVPLGDCGYYSYSDPNELIRYEDDYVHVGGLGWGYSRR